MVALLSSSLWLKPKYRITGRRRNDWSGSNFIASLSSFRSTFHGETSARFKGKKGQGRNGICTRNDALRPHGFAIELRQGFNDDEWCETWFSISLLLSKRPEIAISDSQNRNKCVWNFHPPPVLAHIFYLKRCIGQIDILRNGVR